MTGKDTRKPVKIGVCFSAASFVFVVSSLLCFAFTPSDAPLGWGNFLWILSLIPAIIGELCYLSDLPRAIKDAKQNRQKPLNILLVIALIISIPLILIVGGNIYWGPWHLLLFALELISIKADKRTVDCSPG